jgi:hypothetical protein
MFGKKNNLQSNDKVLYLSAFPRSPKQMWEVEADCLGEKDKWNPSNVKNAQNMSSFQLNFSY